MERDCQVSDSPLSSSPHFPTRILGNRSSISTSTPHSPLPEVNPKGGISLTPNTVIKRSKTLFGSSIIEIKSEYDSITLCAYNSVDDSAWFSELYHALERVKKIYRDENSNGTRHLPDPLSLTLSLTDTPLSLTHRTTFP
jgi:hypothetical protein